MSKPWDNEPTPIEPQKSQYKQYKDVAIEINKFGWLEAINPNNNNPYTLKSMPCIFGPEWAFAGFIWEKDSCPSSIYYSVVGVNVVYAKAVRFCRVKGYTNDE